MIKVVATIILIMIATIVVRDINRPTTAKIIYSPTVIPSPTPILLSDRILWSLIQKWRISENRSSYVEDERLCKIADDRVDDPKLDNHQGFIKKYNLPYPAQENLSTDYSEKETLTGWLASPGHAETLRKPYKASCVRCLGDYCVQIFSNLDY